MSKKKFIGTLMIAILLIMFLGNFRTYMVLGESDMPTFYSGDKVIINRSAYDLTIPFANQKFLPWRSPQRGDMILCQMKKMNTHDFWLKRIIGLPGDTILIRGNKIFLNNQPLRYELLKKDEFTGFSENILGDIVAIESGLGLRHLVTYSETKNIISDFGPLVVAEDHYFVLGDNRFNSLDSRFLGQVPRQNIFGKYLFRIYRQGS